MIQSKSFSKLSDSIERVRDIESPSEIMSKCSTKFNIDDLMNDTSSIKTLPLDGSYRNGNKPQPSSLNTSSGDVSHQVFAIETARFSGASNARSFTPAPTINSKREVELRLQSMITGAVISNEAAKAKARAKTVSKKAKSTEGMTKEEIRRRALKHTSEDVEDDHSDDEEEIAPETEYDRAFIATSSEDDTFLSSDSDFEEGYTSTEGNESPSEDQESSEYDSEEIQILTLLNQEDAEFGDEDETPVVVENKQSEYERELMLQYIATEKKYLKPIDMTYVHGLTTGGYGACTVKNLVVMLSNSAMSDLYSYIEMPVSRVKAILTASSEYNNRVPLSKGSTEGTVLAYRLWLHTRERIRIAALEYYEGFDAMVDFLESLVRQPLVDSFFLIKKEIPDEFCCITGNNTDFGFEIISSSSNNRVSVLWFDRSDKLVSDICLNFMRIWFLPFTLRSFVESKIKPKWPNASEMSKQQIIHYYFEHIQMIVYRYMQAFVESFISTMRFFGIDVVENTELSYS